MPEEKLSLTKDDLKEIIAAAVGEAVKQMKAPSEVEQKKLDAEARQIKQDQENRLKTSKSVLEGIEQKKWIHATCSHEHKNGDSHCVYITERTGPGYILCQKNQCIIRPGNPPAGYKGNDIYDTALFNRIFQKLPGNELMG